jgi:hypothetical protein
VRIASNQPAITRRSASGSRLSPSRVESVTSQKSTVTVFRADGAGLVRASGAPQFEQKFADGRFGSPHAAHAAIA